MEVLPPRGFRHSSSREPACIRSAQAPGRLGIRFAGKVRLTARHMPRRSKAKNRAWQRGGGQTIVDLPKTQDLVFLTPNSADAERLSAALRSEEHTSELQSR